MNHRFIQHIIQNSLEKYNKEYWVLYHTHYHPNKKIFSIHFYIFLFNRLINCKLIHPWYNKRNGAQYLLILS